MAGRMFQIKFFILNAQDIADKALFYKQDTQTHTQKILIRIQKYFTLKYKKNMCRYRRFISSNTLGSQNCNVVIRKQMQINVLRFFLKLIR